MSDSTLTLQEKFSRELEIFTHMTDEEKFKLHSLAAECRGKTFVEIGSYLGASSCFIAAALQENNSQAQLYCIDTWKNDAMSEGPRDTFEIFTENTKPYAEFIQTINGRSEEVHKDFNKEVDFIFFDADHAYEGIKADWECYKGFLKEGTIVVFHDIGWAEGVQKVVEEDVKPLLQYYETLPNMGWGVLKAAPGQK